MWGKIMNINKDLLTMWPQDSFFNDDQLKRLEKSTSAKLIPEQIDKATETCIFLGSQKKPYKTTLSSCECRDYILRRRPCKHMYRAAFEFGYIVSDEFDTDPQKATQLRNMSNGYLFSEALDILEQYSDDCQVAFWHCISRLEKDSLVLCIEKSSGLTALIADGIFSEKRSAAKILSMYKRKDLFSLLDKFHPDIKYKKNIRTDLLCELCLSELTEDEIYEMCQEYIVLELNPRFYNTRHKLKKYFTRKYDNFYYYDGNTKTGYPDDDITNELIQRGHLHETNMFEQNVEITPATDDNPIAKISINFSQNSNMHQDKTQELNHNEDENQKDINTRMYYIYGNDYIPSDSQKYLAHAFSPKEKSKSAKHIFFDIIREIPTFFVVTKPFWFLIIAILSFVLFGLLIST